MKPPGGLPMNGTRIEQVRIRDYKGIDSLVLDFPLPKMRHEPDVFVLGSQNGVGKTAVLESCAFLLLALLNRVEGFAFHPRNLDVGTLVRAGADRGTISGRVRHNDTVVEIDLNLSRNGQPIIGYKHLTGSPLEDLTFDSGQDSREMMGAVCGLTPNPVITKLFLFFHSSMTIPSGSTATRNMIAHGQTYDPSSMSHFKNHVLQALLSQAGLFKAPHRDARAADLLRLNELLHEYADATIDGLHPRSDGTLDINVRANGNSHSYTIDGLSSGQKQTISTLYLIFHKTRAAPRVVFFDEPELHLNAQWHRRFVDNLHGQVPGNQYLMATHSEDVMRSVASDRRIFLRDSSPTPV